MKKHRRMLWYAVRQLLLTLFCIIVAWNMGWLYGIAGWLLMVSFIFDLREPY